MGRLLLNRGSIRGWITLALAVILLLFAGCGSPSSPTSPGNSPTTRETNADSSRLLWGMWEVQIDPGSLDVEIIPVRTAMFNANVVHFMQPPVSPTHMISIAIDLGDSDIPNNLLAIDVIIRHPFPGYYMYRGFDVRGIFMSDASLSAGFDTSAQYANWFDAGPGVPTTESVLLNADGYTRWWNPSEFTSYGSIFGYIPGGLATPGYTASATLNPFKCFADELDTEDPFELDPVNRGTFSVSKGVNSRRYLIQFDGSPFQYNYAVDASWDEPDPSFAPFFPVEAFGESANCQEAYKVSITDTGTTAWYEDSDHHGGFFLLDIEVSDWQAIDQTTVVDETDSIWIESPAFSAGSGTDYLDVLAGPHEVLPGANHTSAVFRVQVDPDFSTGGIDAPGLYPVLVATESADPNTYEPQIEGGGGNFDWPDAPLAAYDVGTVSVLDQSPLEPVLVLEDPVVFTADQPGYHAYSPAIIVENDGDVVIAYCEWDEGASSYAAAWRSKNDGDTWPDWEWNQHFTSPSYMHAGDATKIWPSSHDLSYRTANLIDVTETTWSTGHAAGTFVDGPNGSEKANSVNSGIVNANEILQDSDKYVYILADSAGRITFKRSDSPECLNCTPPPYPWDWYPLPTYDLVDPGRLSRVRSSALYNDTMYLAYFEPAGDVARLAYNVGDGFTWNTSTKIWDADGSGAHSPRDPGLHIDETGFHVTFVRTDFLTGFNELCYTHSDDGAAWSEPVVIRSNVFTITDSPICHYDWDGTPTLGTVWWEGDGIWAAFSTDGGDMWSSPIHLSETYNLNRHSDLVIAPSGSWHFVFNSYNPTSGFWEIHYRRAHMEWQ